MCYYLFLITLLAFLTSGFNLSVFFFPFSFSISWILEFPGIKGLEIGLRFIVCFTAFSVYYLPFFLFWILFYFLLVCCLNRVYRSLKIVKFIFIHLRILGGGNLLCLHSYGDSYMNLLCIADIFPILVYFSWQFPQILSLIIIFCLRYEFSANSVHCLYCMHLWGFVCVFSFE